MVTKSKMFSRAAAGWILFFLLSELYSFFMPLWQECKDSDLKFWKVFKLLFEEKATREGMWVWVAGIAAMFVLVIALFLNNRGVFFVGALINCGAVGYRLYKLIENLNKQKNVKWTADFTIKFIASYVLIALVSLLVLLMAIFVLSGSSAAKGFGFLTAFFAAAGLILVVLLDILPYTSDSWKKGNVGISVSYLDTGLYLTGLIFILLVVRWACAWVDEYAAKVKNGAGMNGAQPVNPYSVTRANQYMAAPAAGYANPTAALYGNPATANQAPQQPVYQAPQAPQQPAYQAPQQPAYQAPQAPQTPQQPAYQAPSAPAAPQQPAYQAPQTPQQPQQSAYQAPQQSQQPAYQAPQAPEKPVYQAPEQPAYQAPEKPVYQTPEQPAYQAPAQAVNEYAANANAVADRVEETADDAASDFSAWTGGVIPGAVNEAAAAVNDTVAEAETPDDATVRLPQQ
ncbi:MAG: hypothetical protein J6Y20_02535 [Lachnospiraceae bacterium]|nr:hypothetical protein [Lachnospiraceae bacterium]